MTKYRFNLCYFFQQMALAMVLLLVTSLSVASAANDLPLAAGSPLAGFAFDDRPLLLPVQRNFQMAMLTASSDIGRSCGKMESYGWRMSSSEQQRVNLIFSNTVDRLRALGYVVEAQAPRSVSRDVTLFTADRSDRHFILMWSAGEIGLVMVLCESSPPLLGNGMTKHSKSSTQALPPMPHDVLQSKLDLPVQSRGAKGMAGKFSPVGDWIGDYTCMQGNTGGTLHIDSLKGEDFVGSFRFYPTAKNRTAAKGSYTIYGQYDADSHRILINPGKWIERPKNFYNTIIVGSFDPINRTFSGFFQGIMGCTSFEARYSGNHEELKAVHKKPKKKKQKKKAEMHPYVNAPASALPSGIPPASDGIKLPDNAAAPLPASPAWSPPPAPALPTPPTASPAAPAATAPTQAVPAPQATPAPTPLAPVSPAPAPVAPKPTSSLDLEHKFVVASGERFNPTVPQAPSPSYYNTTVPQVSSAPQANTTVPQVSAAPSANINVPQAPTPNYVAPSVPEVPEASELPLPSNAPGPSYYNSSVPEVPQAPEAQKPDYLPVPPVSPYN